MPQVSTPLPFAHIPRPLTLNGAIEWEELPSLADTLAERLVVLGTRHRDAIEAARSRAATFERVASGAWDATRPADLEPQRPPQPFREPLHGMAVREVIEPDVFRHFFGTASGASASGR